MNWNALSSILVGLCHCSSAARIAVTGLAACWCVTTYSADEGNTLSGTTA